MSRRITKAVILVFAVTLLGYYFSKNAPNPSPTVTPSPTPTPLPTGQSLVLGQQTKASNCVMQDKLPDKNCTPGAVIPGVTKDQICTPGYSQTVRNVSVQTKNDVYKEYGILTHSTGEYEVDHFISLELGGSNDISNLWPEPAEPKPGFHEKDQVENYLHQQVCDNKISLSEAQRLISQDWLTVYNSLPK